MSSRPLFRPVCLFVALLWTLLPLPAGSAPTSASNLQQQRQRFTLALTVARHGPDGAWRAMATGLESYPLYAYLQLASMQRRMDTLKRAEVDRFLAAWPDSVAQRRLRADYLRELARRGDWKNFRSLYRADEADLELRCDDLHGRLARGEKLDFQRQVQPLWLSSQTLPKACDDAVAWARAHHKLTAALIWKRIDLAANAGNISLVQSLAGSLHGRQRVDAKRLISSLANPAKALAGASGWPDTARTHRALQLAFTRLARSDSAAAEARWKQLGHRFHFSRDQRDQILHAIAVQRAADYAGDALSRLQQLPARAADDTSREWRVRVALADKRWADALAALDALSPEQRADAHWRYLRARVLVKLGRSAEAAREFAGIADEANFHGFLAADWLDQPYTICPASEPDVAAAEAALLANPALVRALEFFAVDMLPQARSEWNDAMRRFTAQQRREAAALAARRGWYDRAVYAFGNDSDMRQYSLRFPLARRAQVVQDARTAGIEPAWAYAIIRAESAWTADAHSGADAYGLMQLLPATARQIAGVAKLPFSGATDLFDPVLNIQLGTRYLADMAVRYDGSPWLASAAYNAGPDPISDWINARDTLEPDFFIETIPYRETRDYVARVLAFSVIYDWRLHGDVLPLASRLPRIGQTYSPPGGNAPRKAVVCPKPTATAQVASAASSPGSGNGR